MNWVEDAKSIFNSKKPEHFTDYKHCEECAEHDQTLICSSIDTIGLEELGNIAWDPMCFCTPEGKKYYMPALIRLSLDTINDEFYLEQLLFLLEGDGKGNKLYDSCSEDQRQFIVNFIEFVISNFAGQLEDNCTENEAFRTHSVWENT